MSKPLASLSLDLDNQWSYMKTHGDAGWESFPSYLDVVVPRVLNFLQESDQKITFFIVGQDAALEKNHAALASISAAGHEIGNHSFITNRGCIFTRSSKSKTKLHRRKLRLNAPPVSVQRDFEALDSVVLKLY